MRQFTTHAFRYTQCSCVTAAVAQHASCLAENATTFPRK